MTYQTVHLKCDLMAIVVWQLRRLKLSYSVYVVEILEKLALKQLFAYPVTDPPMDRGSADGIQSWRCNNLHKIKAHLDRYTGTK